MKRMMAYVLPILLAGLVAGLWAVQANAANRDLEQLLPLSGPFMASDKKVIIKHTGVYRTFTDKAAFEQLGGEIRTKLGLDHAGNNSGATAAEETDHLLYKAAASSNGIETTLLWVGFPDGTTRLIVSAEADISPENPGGILNAQRQLSRGLEALGVTPQWNVMIQGNAAAAFQSRDLQLQNSLVKQLQAQEVGRYEDTGSWSVSYYSPQISGKATAGGKEKMNLQVAVHRNSNTQQQRITIGTPAISIEY